MKKYIIPAAIAATLLATGCFQDIHELDASKNVGYVVPELQWADPSDAGKEIHDLLVVVSGEGESYTRHYASAKEFASEPLEVPAGEAGILVLANATEADGIRVSGLPATKFTMAEMLINCAIISVLSGNGLPVFTEMMAGSSIVHVQPHALYAPVVKLQQVFPILNMTIADIPESKIVEATLDNLADGIVLSTQGGEEAAPGKVTLDGKLTLKTFSSMDDHLSGVTHPTVAGDAETEITLTIRDAADSASGKAQQSLTLRKIKICAPRIDCGKKYTVTLNFKDLVPEMHLGSYNISDWEEGWTYNGRVY